MNIPRRDWEALSAYVDGELSKRATTQIEKRLQSEPALQIALSKLQRTQKILSRSPRMLAPRDFRLTPEMVGQTVPTGSKPPRRAKLFSAFRMAATLASVLLVAVLVLDFGSGTMSSDLAMAPAAKYAVEEAAVANDAVANDAVADNAVEETAVEKSVAESTEAGEVQMEAMAVKEAEEEVAQPLAEGVGAAPQAEKEVAEPAAEDAAARDAVAEDTAAKDAAAEYAVAEEEYVAATEVMPSPSPGEDVHPTVDASPTDTPPAPTVSSSPTGESSTAQSAPSSSISAWRVLEVVLVLAVLGFGAAAWLTRCKK